MNNEIQRKITSLTLMTIMLAGGMSFAIPGMEPANAATGDLYVSASEVGNFAGIQVIEIVVDDPSRSDTSESQGIPNVEINGDDVLMAQADDGAWYGYIANQLAIDTYGAGISALYGATATATAISGSDAENTFLDVENFLDGFKDLSDSTAGAGSLAADGTITLTSVPVGATVTVNDLVYTAVAGGKGGDNTLFSIDTSDTAAAIDLADSINNRVAETDVTATSAINVVTVQAVAAGSTGNTIDTSSSSATAAVGDITVDTVVGADFAFATVTALAAATATSTVTIDGNAYTGIATITDSEIQFLADGAGALDATDAADSLVIAINSDTRVGADAYTATNTAGVVTISAAVRGTAGNAITIVTSDGTNLAITDDDAGTLDAGVDFNDFVTVNNLDYFAVVGVKDGNTQFSVDTSNDAAAADLALSITALDAAVVTAADTTNVVTITATVAGVAGNGLQLSETVANVGTTITAFAGGSDQTAVPEDDFLTGGDDGTGVNNNPNVSDSEWPFIQTYDISDNSDVTITYGTGGTADSITILYDYDDDKDISLDRQKYPSQSYVFIDLDDSLLNLSPTAEDVWEFEEAGDVNYYVGDGTISVAAIVFANVGFEEGPFEYDTTPGVYQLAITDIGDDLGITESASVLFRESNDNDNIFVNYDRSDKSNLIVTNTNGEASVSYNDAHSIIQDTFNGAIKYLVTVDEWLSGIELGVELVDEDRNLNSKIDETIAILDDEVPYIAIGDALHLDDATVTGPETYDETVKTNSEVYDMEVTAGSTNVVAEFDWPYPISSDNGYVFSYANFDFSELGGASGTAYLGDTDGSLSDNLPAGVAIAFVDADTFTLTFSGLTASADGQVYLDILSFGQEGDISDAGATIFTGDIEDNVDRVNDSFYRFELEETDDNTATYTGTVEYIMINQLNVFDKGTYDNIKTEGDDVVIIVNDDSDGADAIRISYNDKDSTDNDETISAQEDANTHSGHISLDKEGYTAGNTITVTLEDADLNTDSDTIQTYDVAPAEAWLGEDNVWLVQMLVNDKLYDDTCGKGLGLDDTGLTLTETTDQSGIFVGTLKLPALYCDGSDDPDQGGVDTLGSGTTNGLDIEFEYQDYADASGKPNETSNTASIRSTTGSVNLDKTVYGVPIHADSFKTYDGLFLDATPTKLVIHVDDSDFNVSASGEDTLSADSITVQVSRSGEKITIDANTYESTLVEIAPDAGIFELEVLIPQQEYFTTSTIVETDYIHQGDIITITYEDDSDASGSSNTVTDSATFDLRNGVLQADKSVYVIGSDAIITLIEPDLNLDSETAETWSLGLVNWDSDAGEDDLSNDIFDAQPTGLRETGDDTGIFQVVIQIPEEFDDGDKLERGEEIDLEYTDYGPAGADYINDEDEEVNLFIYTSNFGATIELDQKVYSWTDKVYITIVAPDHNFDSDKIDEIGIDEDSAINVSTREDEIENYKLVETGTDTGIFTGEVILTGYAAHDADGDGEGGEASGLIDESGPTGGQLPAGNDDGLTVSFEYSDGDTVIGSALIRWNIGEVQWLEASYPATASGVIRVIDSDMNFNPEAVDNFEIDVWSDTDAGGISLSVTETNEATGIFEGTVFFTVSSASSGSRLNVNEGDTVTAEYEDNTLPDPYSTADELDVTATTLIGTLVPPLERAPAANLRAVDAFGNSLDSVQVDQQVQVSADLSNGQDRDQEFAYLLQVQNQDGVTVSLSWITGTLQSGQSFNPSVSWIPSELGDYEATVFVWESVDNPTALSPPVSTTIQVS